MLLRAAWSPVLVTALALLGYHFQWPMEVLAPGLVVIVVIGLVVVATGGREREQERASLRLRELAGYFSRRFAGNSPLSIFAIIDSLYTVENPKVWDWARACDMAQRLFNGWCERFISRVESDIMAGRFTLYQRTYLSELWLINSHYHEFVEQFYEVAEKVEMPRETVDQYNRFVMEYNAFVQHFQDYIVELKRFARTEIEPPSIKVARELSGEKPAPPVVEEKKPPPPAEHKGYIM